jgi:hypothetical protein
MEFHMSQIPGLREQVAMAAEKTVIVNKIKATINNCTCLSFRFFNNKIEAIEMSIRPDIQ